MIEIDVALKRGSFELATAFTNDAGITALFGRSGSGKSTLIHLIAGLVRPDRGRIVLDGRVLVDTAEGFHLPRHRRRVGMVYQDAQLFPHLSVRQNLLFGRMFSPKNTPRIAFDGVIETLGIGTLLSRRPAQLSGGEKQRVALGRALLANPSVLLMDEPLAALDTARKLEILPLIEHLRDEFGIPIVYVSHAVDEVARLASKVVVLEAGKVVAIGMPGEVLSQAMPSVDHDRFTRSSVLELVAGDHDARYGLTALRHPAGVVHLAGRIEPSGRVVRIVVPATEVTLATEPPKNLSIRNALRGTVARIDRNGGPVAAIVVSLIGGGSLTSLATRKALDDLGLGPGDAVFALIKTAALDERPVAAGVIRASSGEGAAPALPALLDEVMVRK